MSGSNRHRRLKLILAAIPPILGAVAKVILAFQGH